VTRKRSWPITVGGFGLVAQSAAILATGLALWPVNAVQMLSAPAEAPVGHALLPLLAALTCFLLALAALLTGLTFLRQRPHAWLNALSLQGLTLLGALLLYFRGHHTHSYPLMMFGIAMVVHLNRADVMAPFTLRVPTDREGRDDR
jgi:hypothetical protein